MRNIHVVSHTHWDREWYLPFQLFRLKLIHMVDKLLEILEHDQEYKYFMLDGQTIILDDYLHMRPEKETILREHICNGRIIIGPWHILPDMFLVGPEAHIRNLLQGDRTAREIGPKMMIGYMPDSFGHIGQIPQILRGFGIQIASLWRGVYDGPNEFWWQAPDGSRVLMAYLREGYGNGADLPADDLERFANMISDKVEALVPFSATNEFLIMYGTDHMEPPLNTPKAIAFAGKTLGNTRVVHSTLSNYVTDLQSSLEEQKTILPTIVGELRACKRMHLLPGVLSTRMWIKQRNQACESLLGKWVEPFSTFADGLTTYDSSIASPSKINQLPSVIRETWRLLMENHPHDSICGCSIDQVHREMKIRFDEVEQIGEEITNQNLDAIAACISTEGSSPTKKNIHSSNDERSALIVFNPSSTVRTDLITATIDLPSNIYDFELVDEKGNSIPYQEQAAGGYEIINITLDAKGLQSAFGNITDGRAAGMTIQDIKTHRDGPDVFIEAIMMNGGEPNILNWNARREEILVYFADKTITTYHVRAVTAPTTKITVSVPNVPSFGYQTLWVCPHTTKDRSVYKINPWMKLFLPLARLPFISRWRSRKLKTKPPFIIENGTFNVEAQKDGTVTVKDKRTGFIYTGMNCFLDGGDCGDEYNYSPPPEDVLSKTKLKDIRIIHGPVQQVLEINLELSTPTSLVSDRKSRSQDKIVIPIRSTISLTNGIPRIDICTEVNNRARDHRLRVHFPAPFRTVTGSHDGHFEVVERKIGIPSFDDTWVEQPRPEVPQRAFTDVSDGISGLTIANRGLPEVEVLQNSSGKSEIAITLLRCVGWLSRDDFSTRKGHAGPALETPEAQMSGTWKFDYSIIPHEGDWHNAYLQGYSFETPMRLVSTGIHPGILPGSCSFMEVHPPEFVVSAVKQREEGDGWIVRGYNITNEEIQVTIKLWKPFQKTMQVNLAEENLAALKINKDRSVNIQARGHEIISVSFQN